MARQAGERKVRKVIRDEPAKQFRNIPPQMGPKARARYLARDDVKLWLRRNARKLRVVDVRAIAQLKPEIVEWAEIYYVKEEPKGGKVLKCRIIAGDPPPRIPPKKRKPQED